MKSQHIELEGDTFSNLSKLIYASVLLWLTSLALPAFVSFSSKETLFGWNVLLMGWLGPLALNFAWFANIFLFLAIGNLIEKDKSATGKAGWAVILSLNTFTFEFIPNAVNGGNPIYGFGIGSALWLTAIALTFLAATIKEKQLTGKFENLFLSKLYLVILVALISYLAIHDRVLGNADELKKLNGSLVAFKRSKICSASPKPTNRIVLNGSLELAPSLNYAQKPSKSYFLDDPETFLSLGIPVVRKDGLDYYLENINDIKSIKSRPANTKIAATLTVIGQISRHGDHDSTMAPMYRVNLVNPEGLVGFNEIVMKQYVREYCPSNIELLVKQTFISPTK